MNWNRVPQFACRRAFSDSRALAHVLDLGERQERGARRELRLRSWTRRPGARGVDGPRHGQSPAQRRRHCLGRGREHVRRPTLDRPRNDALGVLHALRLPLEGVARGLVPCLELVGRDTGFPPERLEAQFARPPRSRHRRRGGPRRLGVIAECAQRVVVVVRHGCRSVASDADAGDYFPHASAAAALYQTHFARQFRSRSVSCLSPDRVPSSLLLSGPAVTPSSRARALPAHDVVLRRWRR